MHRLKRLENHTGVNQPKRNAYYRNISSISRSRDIQYTLTEAGCIIIDSDQEFCRKSPISRLFQLLELWCRQLFAAKTYLINGDACHYRCQAVVFLIYEKRQYMAHLLWIPRYTTADAEMPCVRPEFKCGGSSAK